MDRKLIILAFVVILWMAYQCVCYQEYIQFEGESRLRLENNVTLHLMRRCAANRRYRRISRALINLHNQIYIVLYSENNVISHYTGPIAFTL